MDLPAIRTLYRTELRMVLRDRRTIFFAIVLPAVVMPIMMFASYWTNQLHEKKLESRTYRYAITGAASDFGRRAVEAAREKSLFGFAESRVPAPMRSLGQGEIDFIVQCVSESASGSEEPPVPGAPLVRILYRSDRDVSEAGARAMLDALRKTRKNERDTLLASHAFPAASRDIARVIETDVASAGQVAGLKLGRTLTVLLLFFVLSGAAIVATDSIAGERERGTLETLLTTAASRNAIVAAKQLVIVSVAIIVTLIQVANFLIYASLKIVPIPTDFGAAVPPRVAALLLLMYLPVAVLASSALLLVSGYAKSYKEAQLYFFPITLLGAAPALAPFLPGLALRSAIVVVPVANISVAVKEILTGVNDWPMILIAWVTTVAAALVMVRQTGRVLSMERLIAPAVFEEIPASGGLALFETKVLRWFALLWAAIFLGGQYLEPRLDLRGQVLFSAVIVFLGGSYWMVRRFRLDPCEVWALRPVRPAVWIAVLLGAPSALIAVIGVSKLASRFLPVPQSLVESFGRALLPEDIPRWQLLAVLSVLPAICEEIAFRGTLLYGLHRRLRPATLALAVGAIFGIFHFALFRILPTALLGVVLSVVTLMTGSILPAMLWHALNNCLGVLAGLYDVPVGDLDPWIYGLAAIPLAAALWLLWRNRSPYPGLRRWRR